MEPGESVTEACVREVLEETGLVVSVARLIGVYSDPDRLVVYADGNAVHVVGLCFLAEHRGGTLQLDQHRERIEDAFADRSDAFIR